MSATKRYDVNWSVALLLVSTLLTALPVQALEFSTRLKWFTSAAALPSHDLQRQIDGTPAYDYSAELRLMFEQDTGPLSWILQSTTTVNGGDSFDIPSTPETKLETLPENDNFRLMDLAWEIEQGSRHRSLERLDRMAVRYRADTWSVTLGRDAVTWGNGIVFQPLDLFNPFSPTTVDRDYKVGDDMVLVDKLFGNGMDAQLLAVVRRNARQNVSSDSSSLAMRLRGFAGNIGWELAVGEHFEDQIYGLGLRVPLGGALMRTDLVFTDLNGGGWEFSGVINIDYSFTLRDKNFYVFAEYYRSGFGVDELPDSVVQLPEDLLKRLGRGEVFTLMKDYLAVGTTIEWHPLWNQNLSLLNNLDDGSSLLQSSLGFEPGDHSRLELGLVLPLGKQGDEYGGVPVLNDNFTSGGGKKAYFRYVYFF